MSRFLGRVQRALENLYRVDGPVDVREFVITAAERAALGVSRQPGEQLLLRFEPGGMSIGLFVDEETLARLERGPSHERIDDFLIAVEGVSHFLYATARAHAERPFSALELELQAEVDKYVMTLLATWPAHGPPPSGLRRRLFRAVRYHDDLSDEERERYATANAAAEEYTAALEHRFVRRRAVEEMLAELRRFWRLDCAGKLDRITRRAA
jgi:hypothetical protein